MKKPKGYDDITDREQRVAYIKGLLPQYVNSITTRDPKKRQFYLCMLDECKEREHTNSTGGAFSIAADKVSWHCFSCNRGGDIFDLIGYIYGYKSGKLTRSSEFEKEYTKALDIFGLKEDFTPLQDEQPAEPPKAPDASTESTPAPESQPESQPETEAAAAPAVQPTAGKFKEYLEKCHSACTEGSRGYEYLIGRGFTPHTIERFLLGYDSSKDAITIPYSQSYNYYVTRSIEGKAYEKPPKETAGEEPVFNGAALNVDRFCFVCESQLDAISIMQAGGIAVAVGGTGINKLLKVCKNKLPQHCLILCFDNDESGQRGQREAAEHLDAEGIDFIEAHFNLELYGDPQKDSNDLLRSNADQLSKDILENIRAAKDHELESGSGLYAVGEYKSLFQKHQTAEKQRISTGFNSLDRALYGGFTNELYILSAETSIGKSAITTCLAQNIAASGIDVLYYALEMGRDEFIARGASMISREHNDNPIPYAEILNYKWDERTQEFYRRPYSSYERYVDEYMGRYGEHLFFIEGGFFGKTALSIAETAENFKKERGVKQLVIIVDYLQRLIGDPEDRAQRDAMSVTSAAVRVLGNLASQKHNTVIAISSISNAQKGQRVTDAAGKYSGDIGYTGGILLGWNWHGYTDTNKEEDKQETAKQCKERGYREMILEILKQRSGERDNKLTMFYYPQYNYFTAPNTDGKAQPHRR